MKFSDKLQKNSEKLSTWKKPLKISWTHHKKAEGKKPTITRKKKDLVPWLLAFFVVVDSLFWYENSCEHLIINKATNIIQMMFIIQIMLTLFLIKSIHLLVHRPQKILLWTPCGFTDPRLRTTDIEKYIWLGSPDSAGKGRPPISQ